MIQHSDAEEKMKLIHYTDKKFSFENRQYNQYKLMYNAKPNGFWVSIKGDDDWKSWCESENFNLDKLVVSYEVKLKKNANIIHLKTPIEVFEFGKKFYLKNSDWQLKNYCGQIKWDDVKNNYQGIIISPYQWVCRMAVESRWYYGWDCASGCIWDLDCVETLENHD